MYKNLIKIDYGRSGWFIAFAAVLVIACSVILSTATSAQSPPAPAAPGSSLDQRVAQRKAERNVVIPPKDQQRLVNVCVASQNRVRTLQQKTTVTLADRAKTNQQIDAKIWITIGKLKVAQKDTFQLEKQRAGLADKVSAFQQTGQNYNQALDDLVAVNCKADLVAFKALLDTARIYRAQLRDQSTDIRNYLNNDIKPSLSAYASELQIKPSVEGGR